MIQFIVIPLRATYGNIVMRPDICYNSLSFLRSTPMLVIIKKILLTVIILRKKHLFLIEQYIEIELTTYSHESNLYFI